jgi:hypothetical protein
MKRMFSWITLNGKLEMVDLYQTKKHFDIFQQCF